MSKTKTEPEMPLRLEWRTPEELADNPRNWRSHPAAQMDGLSGAIREAGWAGAALYNEKTGRLIDGHGRKRLDTSLLVDGKMPVLVGSWTEEQERVILATLDPLAGLAEADDVQLEDLLASIEVDDEDLRGLLDQLADDAGIDLDDPGEVVEDEAPEPPVEPVTRAGDLWVLGEHRLLAGDSTKAEDVARVMNGERVNVVFTSPPYASQRKYDENSGFKPIHPDAYVDWWEPIQNNVKSHLAPDGSFFVNVKEHCDGGQRHLYVKDWTIAHVRRWGWMFVDEFCWRDTKNGVPGGWTNRFKDAWEPVFHFALGCGIKFRPDAVSSQSDQCFDYSAETGKSSNGSGLKSGAPAGGLKSGRARPSNVVECAAANGQDGHSAAFPLALPAFFLRAFSDANDVVFEPFSGSGTTIIAAEQLNRRCFSIEISPQYCDVSLVRWQNLTGKDAVLEATGETFAQVKESRLGVCAS